MDFQQPGIFNRNEFEKIGNKKSDFIDFKNLQLKCMYKSNTHPAYITAEIFLLGILFLSFSLLCTVEEGKHSLFLKNSLNIIHAINLY